MQWPLWMKLLMLLLENIIEPLLHRETQPLIYLVYLRRYQQNGSIYQMEDMPVLMLVRQE